MSRLLWSPSETVATDTQIAEFAARLRDREGFDWQVIITILGSIRSITGKPSGHISGTGRASSAARAIPFWLILKNDRRAFFPAGSLNYAENMLADDDDTPAIIAHAEGQPRRQLSRRELAAQVKSLAGWLSARGVVAGDRVAAYTPNTPEAIITMLAAASIGAVFSSCSSDFGLGGVKDRFGQIAPKILMAADGYLYNGKPIERMSIIRDLLADLPSVRADLPAS